MIRKVTAQIVEVNDSQIRLRSHAWKGWENIPESYVKTGNSIEVVDDPHLTVIIPLDKIQYIYRYEQRLTKNDLRPLPWAIATGAASGAFYFVLWGLEGVAESETGGTGFESEAGQFFVIYTAVGALVGAVITPLYIVLKTVYGHPLDDEIINHSSVFPVNRANYGYQMQIAPLE